MASKLSSARLLGIEICRTRAYDLQGLSPEFYEDLSGHGGRLEIQGRGEGDEGVHPRLT
jgi:hypothetical protein